jgi:phage tail sheath protein FI
MAFQLSPGVNVSEVDLTTIVPAVGTTEGAFAGHFNWGPAEQVVTISSEVELVSSFGKPDSNTFVDFFTAANFLAYARNLKVVRAIASTTYTATANGSTSVQIKNLDAYENTYATGAASATVGGWAAKYPGELGNSLEVSVCPSANAFSATLINATAMGTINTSNILFTSNMVANTIRSLTVGDILQLGNANVTLANVTVLSIDSAGRNVVTTGSFTSETDITKMTAVWQYASQFDGPPGTSTYVSNVGGSNDEMHVIVIDEDGKFTGTANTVLEKFPYLSKAIDAKREDGSSSYVRDVIRDVSRYVWWTGATPNTSTGSAASQTTFGRGDNKIYTNSLSSGATVAPTDANKITAYDRFANPEEIDISLIMTGAHSSTVTSRIIDIAGTRKDCVAFLSPERADVVDQTGNEVDNIVGYRNTLTSSSYAFMDSNWKYQFDKYNNVYRWVPLNGDTAGLCVRTDFERDPWFSPAGFNRGIIRNVTRLAWNPDKTDRDELYKKGINPVVAFPGEGTILYGDKTLLSKPSAFDRINVRRLFIVLEKAIARAAKYSLFEFNDAFTRAQFISLVEPYLRDVQGRRGIFDFRVVCDETNNTSEVIDRNEFIGDIYIKPARSINFIQLNFVAVRTGVSFDEIVGKF